MDRKYTLKRDYHDHRDLMLETGAHPLPDKADLRPHMSPIVDQGQLGSCTANAIASGMREYLILKSGQPLNRLSRLFLYWHERDMEGTINEDSGAIIRDGMKALQKIGVCLETDYPYDISKFTEQPTSIAETDAAVFKIKSYHRARDLHGLKYSLAHYKLPVVFGFTVYESFESSEVANTGFVPMPNKNERQLGGHAVMAVGYDDEKQVVIVRNSWGERWGDKGYCYMPYSFFENGIVTDMWVGRG